MFSLQSRFFAFCGQEAWHRVMDFLQTKRIRERLKILVPNVPADTESACPEMMREFMQCLFHTKTSAICTEHKES